MKAPFLELGSLSAQINGLKSVEGFSRERGRETSRKSSPPRSLSASMSPSPVRTRPSSRQASVSRSRSRSASQAASITRTPSPSPERVSSRGKKRPTEDMLDLGDAEPTGHLTVKLSANKASFLKKIFFLSMSFSNVQGATYGCDPSLAQSIDLELFRFLK